MQLALLSYLCKGVRNKVFLRTLGVREESISGYLFSEGLDMNIEQSDVTR